MYYLRVMRGNAKISKDLTKAAVAKCAVMHYHASIGINFRHNKDTDLAKGEKMIEEKSVIEQRRKEKSAAKRKKRRKITRHSCQSCGAPKHYICLEHNSFKSPNKFRRILKKFRRKFRALIFPLLGAYWRKENHPSN